MAALSREVKTYRYQLMRDYMREHQLDALAFATPDWFEWAGNAEMREQAWERPFLLVISADGAAFSIGSEQGRALFTLSKERGTFWADKIHIYEELLEPRNRDWVVPQWPEMVAQALKEAGLGKARIGADSVNKHLAKVPGVAPGVQIAPAPNLAKLRLAKHPEELELMRIAADVSDFAFNLYREELRPGRLMAEIDWLVGSKLAAEGAKRFAGQNFTISSLYTTCGAGSAAPKGDGAPTGKVLENDGYAISTIVTRLNCVTMEVARPWLIGRPPAECFTYLDAAFDAQNAAMDQAVAGRPVSGMHAAALRAFEKAGVAQYFHLRAGHGIGVVMHDFPDDMAYNDRPLLERETYAIEPAIWIEGLGGFRCGDIVAVGAKQAEIITRTPKDRAYISLS